MSTTPEAASSAVAHHYTRVLLKLSGDAFAGGGSMGVDPRTVEAIARQIADVVRTGVNVTVVVGGDTYFWGAELTEQGRPPGRAAYMGMLGTVVDCLALQ